MLSLWKGRIPDPPAKPPTMRARLDDVCARYHVGQATILSRTRYQTFVRPRQELMWLLRQDGYSLPQIGQFMNRHHTSVLFGARAHEARL